MAPNTGGVAGIQCFHDAMYVNKPMVVPLPVAHLADAEVAIAEFLKAHDANYAILDAERRVGAKR